MQSVVDFMNHNILYGCRFSSFVAFRYHNSVVSHL